MVQNLCGQCYRNRNQAARRPDCQSEDAEPKQKRFHYFHRFNWSCKRQTHFLNESPRSASLFLFELKFLSRISLSLIRKNFARNRVAVSETHFQICNKGILGSLPRLVNRLAADMNAADLRTLRIVQITIPLNCGQDTENRMIGFLSHNNLRLP